MNLTWRRQDLTYANPWKIAKGRPSTSKQTLIISIEADGVTGYGEIAPSGTYGQSLASAEAALENVRPLLEGRSPEAVEAHLARLLPSLEGESATLCGIDGALHDWLGKVLGQPIHRLLGVDPAEMPPTSFTIGIDDEATTRRKTREAAAAGWRVLKVKLDERPSNVILEWVCSEFEGPVRVDANTAWTPASAREHLDLLHGFRVEFVEQPYSPREDAALDAFRDISHLPVIVDESFRHVGDFPGLAGKVDGVNVKLSKCGGIRQALTAIRAARRHGMQVMLGCMTQSTLGIAAAAQVAPLVDYVDLDGHLLLRDDPWQGLGVRDGCLVLSPAPGLGVAPS